MVRATIFNQIFSRQLLNLASLFNKKAELPYFGNPAIRSEFTVGSVALRPRLAAGLPLSLRYKNTL